MIDAVIVFLVAEAKKPTVKDRGASAARLADFAAPERATLVLGSGGTGRDRSSFVSAG